MAYLARSHDHAQYHACKQLLRERINSDAGLCMVCVISLRESVLLKHAQFYDEGSKISGSYTFVLHKLRIIQCKLL